MFGFYYCCFGGLERLKKIRIRQRLCKVGAFMLVLCYAFAIATIFKPVLFPVLLVLLVDTVVTILPSFYFIVDDMRNDRGGGECRKREGLRK